MKRRSFFQAVLLSAALAANGCSTTPPSTFYTLTPIPDASVRDTPLAGGSIALGLGPVMFPLFLDRPQIVSRDGANRLTLDEFHRWGGSLQDDFLRVWSENLAHLLGNSKILVFPSEVRFPLDFRILAEVLTFERTPRGEAVLKVRWSVMDPYLERLLVSREGVYRQRVTGSTDDREALAAAMSRTVGDFSQDVADTVRRLPKPATVRVEPL